MSTTLFATGAGILLGDLVGVILLRLHKTYPDPNEVLGVALGDSKLFSDILECGVVGIKLRSVKGLFVFGHFLRSLLNQNNVLKLRVRTIVKRGLFLTKIFVARPPDLHPTSPHREYSVSPETKALMTQKSDIVKPLTYNTTGKGRYVPDGGYEFNLELNVLDTASKLPIRGVDINSGEIKGFSDKLGRIVLRLPRGYNEVVLAGLGYLEKGDFAPESTQFEPILLKVDMDEDAIYTIYSSGQIVPGERKILNNNPGHHGSINSSELGTWLRENWWMLVLGGGVGVSLYYLGKGRSPSH